MPALFVSRLAFLIQRAIPDTYAVEDRRINVTLVLAEFTAAPLHVAMETYGSISRSPSTASDVHTRASLPPLASS